MVGMLNRVWTSLQAPWNANHFYYTLRSVGAAALALGLGLYLQLDAPFSAASTVLLLVNPVQGAVVGKGFHRTLGTLVGMLAAFVLMGLFAQKMLFFIVGVGLWLGICVAAMTLLRHYFATAAVVAGYTVCLALGPAMVEPDLSFEHIITRVSAVSLGVFSLSLVTVLFSRKTLEQKLFESLQNLASRAVKVVALRIANEDEEQLARLRAALSIDILKFDDILGVGRGESRLIRSHISTLHSGLSYLLSAIMELKLSGDEGRYPIALKAVLARLASKLEAVAQAMGRTPAAFASAAQALDELRADLDENQLEQITGAVLSAQTLLTLERIDDRLRDTSHALRNFAGLNGSKVVVQRPVGFHRNVPDALRNGARALVACLIAGAVWYLSGWDQGPTLLAVLCPYCALLAASAMPVQGTTRFVRGTLYAIPAAAICKFLIISQINGFPLLVIVLGVFWSFGVYATTNPRHAFQGIAYLIAFNTLVSTGLSATFDFSDFANQSLAWIVALCISLLAFQIIPKSTAGHADGLRKALHKETLLLLRRAGWHDHERWEARQQHRVVSLKALATGEDAHQVSYIGYLSLQLGREITRLQRRMTALDPASPIVACVEDGLRRISSNRNDLANSAAQASTTANALDELGAHHFSACFADLSWLLHRYAKESSLS